MKPPKMLICGKCGRAVKMPTEKEIKQGSPSIITDDNIMVLYLDCYCKTKYQLSIMEPKEERVKNEQGNCKANRED